MKAMMMLFLAIAALPAWSQKNITMCHSHAIEDFATLASNESFVGAHENPLAYRHSSKAGKEIKFRAADGKEAYGYFLKSKEPSKKFLFVFHEWYGLNDYVKKESEKLFNDLQNVNVLAIDLYDRKIAKNREEASKLVQQVEQERARAIIQGASNFAGEDAEVGTLGWCFGGGWSLQAALLLEENAHACVIYYGMPELDPERLKNLDCEVLGIFASQDQMISPEIVQEFAQKMEAVGNDLEYKMFNAVHAFANPSNPNYDSEATKEAYELAVKFLSREL